MRLLLDTHIWLWSNLEPDKLTRRVARELEKPDNELWLSPISFWEVSMLESKRRIKLDGGAAAWIANRMKTVPFREAALTYEVALETHKITLPHGDPADRFLVATASVFDLTLVTADRRLIGLKQIRVLANR